MRLAIVSLSGGVDSMVLASLLVALRTHGKRPFEMMRILAIHIDYANRAESGVEAEFVRQWCLSRGIEFHMRRIDEVTRGITKRDAYEAVSRSIRFDTYKKVMAEHDVALPILTSPSSSPPATTSACGLTDDEDGESLNGDEQEPFEKRMRPASSTGSARAAVKQEAEAIGVLFGHHTGDLQENVFTNFMNGRSILDLCVMQEQSVVSDVLVWRPLLPHDKPEIFDFAYRFDIPNFLDTTPLWSTRGKLRNETFPHLAANYGNFKLNLSLIGGSSMEWAAVIQQAILLPFYQNNVAFLRLGTLVECSSHHHLPQAFWREVMRHVFFTMGFHTPPSHKSLALIMEVCLSRGNRARPQWLNLRRDSSTLYCPFELLVFHPQFIYPTTAPLFLSQDHLHVGASSSDPPSRYRTPDDNWAISLQRVCLPDDDDRSSAAQRLSAKVSYADILSGSFAYFLPDAPPFFFAGKAKPTAHVHAMLKCHLPIVGIPKQFSRISSDLIRVEINWVAPMKPIDQLGLSDPPISDST